MDKCPLEVYCSIFLHCLPVRKEYNSAESLSFMKRNIVAPVKISHVCRTWRCIALSYGPLWSTVSIHFDTDEQRDFRTDITTEICKAWLSRSNTAPLSIYFYGFDLFWNYHFAQQIIDDLVSQKHRWRLVEFIWPMVKVTPTFQGLHLANMPFLTSLELVSCIKTSEKSLVRPTVDLSSLPGLRNLGLHGAYILEIGEAADLSSLECCTFQLPVVDFSHSIGLCMTILTKAPILTTFTAHSFEVNSPPSSKIRTRDDARLFLPRLSNLGLRKCSFSGSVVDRLTLPSLTTMAYFIDTEMDRGIFLDFLHRSRPPLTCLIFDGLGLNEERLLTILLALPTLERFEVAKARITRRLLVQLTVQGTPEERVICPALRQFCLTPARITFEDEEPSTTLSMISSMMASRQEAFGTFDHATYTLQGFEVFRINSSNIDGLRNTEFAEPADIACGLYVATGKLESCRVLENHDLDDLD